MRNDWKKIKTEVKVRSLKDHLKPSLTQNLGHFVSPFGTNDFDSDRSPDIIAKLIAA